jgi:hypothetical protein
MTKSSPDSQTFSNQNALLRIALGANILAWVILVLTLVDFAGIIRQIVQAWPLNLPTNLFDQGAAWVSIFFKFFVDLFYFFVLRGISQLIYLGMDLYYTRESMAPEEDTTAAIEEG